MTDQGRKDWIDSASYEDLLRIWRFEPTGSPWFTGEVGEHFAEVIVERRGELAPGEASKASQRIGW